MDENIYKAIQKAREVYARYNAKDLVPFPFEEITKNNEDLEILYDDLSENDISGAIVYDADDKKYKILINSSEPKERQYFTLAHEIGHYFLHKKELSEKKRAFVYSSKKYENAMFRALHSRKWGRDDRELRLEREVDNFAAELTMPEDKVKEAWSITDGGLSVEYYAKMFSVSVAAMAIRMETFGLKKRESVDECSAR